MTSHHPNPSHIKGQGTQATQHRNPRNTKAKTTLSSPSLWDHCANIRRRQVYHVQSAQIEAHFPTESALSLDCPTTERKSTPNTLMKPQAGNEGSVYLLSYRRIGSFSGRLPISPDPILRRGHVSRYPKDNGSCLSYPLSTIASIESRDVSVRWMDIEEGSPFPTRERHFITKVNIEAPDRSSNDSCHPNTTPSLHSRESWNLYTSDDESEPTPDQDGGHLSQTDHPATAGCAQIESISQSAHTAWLAPVLPPPYDFSDVESIDPRDQEQWGRRRRRLQRRFTVPCCEFSFEYANLVGKNPHFRLCSSLRVNEEHSTRGKPPKMRNARSVVEGFMFLNEGEDSFWSQKYSDTWVGSLSNCAKLFGSPTSPHHADTRLSAGSSSDRSDTSHRSYSPVNPARPKTNGTLPSNGEKVHENYFGSDEFILVLNDGESRGHSEEGEHKTDSEEDPHSRHVPDPYYRMLRRKIDENANNRDLGFCTMSHTSLEYDSDPLPHRQAPPIPPKPLPRTKFIQRGCEESDTTDSDSSQTKSSVSDRERCLIRKTSLLKTQISKLQVQCKTLTSENDVLKRKMELESERPLATKEKERQKEVQQLKKKNQELSCMTRKLEEKVKTLEKKTKECSSIERRTTVTSRQREKEAEYQRQIATRENEIQRLKEKLRDLSNRLAAKNGEITTQKGTVELNQIIRQANKERLQLERHLAIATKSLQRNTEVDFSKYLALEETNRQLRQQLEELDHIVRQHKHVELQLQERTSKCNELQENYKLKSELCTDLENQLSKVIEKNSELTIKNSDLQQQILELQHISGECEELKEKLKHVQLEWDSAKSEIQGLQGQLTTLESVLKQMQETAAQRKELELQHADAVKRLRDKQLELSSLSQISSAERQKSLETIESLQSKIRELEKKAELQKVHHEELVLEMASIKKNYEKSKIGSCTSTSSQAQDYVSGNAYGIHSYSDLDNDATVTGLSTSSSIHSSGSGPNSLKSMTDSGYLSSQTVLDASSNHPFITSNLSSNVPSSITFGQTNSLGHSPVMSVTGTIAPISPALVSVTPSGQTVITGNFHPGLFSTMPNTMQMNRLSSSHNLPTILTAQYDKESLPLLSSGQTFSSTSLNNKIDMLDIPGKGRCYVYVARYSYDPFHHSPNENPEAELAVNSGDYVLVWGHMDEDGFFDGELLDGRRGLVPSNFVEKLTGEDLLDFHQSVVLGLRDSDDSVSTSIPQDLDFNSSDEAQNMTIEDYRRLDYTYMDLEDIMEEDEDQDRHGEGPDLFFSVLVPAPRQLTLERQLNKSILIGWNPPESSSGTIESYHVYVDGVLKTTIKASERTRALVEGVDSVRPHRISVRSVTPNRRTSRDAACTMVIGKDAPLAPTFVRATNVTSTSAVITWLPSNSNYQHVVCVNSVEVRTVKPGVYRHTITGLTPNTLYRVTVRAKNIKAPNFDEKTSKRTEILSSHIEFKTLPKGLPDPPVDVQVEQGPQDGTLLVTWLPVTINNTGTSNGAPVTGYSVYADGKKITDIDSPTGDHALVDLGRIQSLNPKHITVRTKASDGQSADSVPGTIPSHLLQGKNKARQSPVRTRNSQGSEGDRWRSKPNVSSLIHGRRDERMGYERSPIRDRNTHSSAHRRTDGQMVIETDENLSDKEVYPSYHMNIPSIQITKDSASEGRGSLDNFSEEDYDGMGRRGRIPRNHLERGRPPPPPLDRRDIKDRDRHYGRVEPQRQYRDRADMRDRDSGYRSESNDFREKRRVLPRDQREDAARIFVALFDYDPPSMSPNPDACDEELPFREGQLIKIFGDKDADGFYWGEATGRRGFVPCNMVSEVQVDDERVAQELLRESSGEQDRRRRGSGRRQPSDRWGDIYVNMPVKKMVALYDYDPQELSPNVDSEVELRFQTGDIIYVYGDMDDDGFYMGELKGVRGLVPSNFLTETPPDYEGRHRDPHLGPQGSYKRDSGEPHGPPSHSRERDERRRGSGENGERSSQQTRHPERW